MCRSACALVSSYRDVDPVIGQDEGGVGRCELGVRHDEYRGWVDKTFEMPFTFLRGK